MNRPKIAFSGVLICLGMLGFSDTGRAQSVTVSPQTLAFTVPVNSQSLSQTVAVTAPAPGGGTGSIQVQTPSASWIQVTPGFLMSTPGNLNVSVNTVGLNSGSVYTGTFAVNYVGTSVQQTVTVNLTVTGTSALTATPATLSFTGQAGASSGTPQGCSMQNSLTTCQVILSSTAGQLSYTVTPSATWIQVDRSSGTVGGAALNVGVNPSFVPNGTGTYTGSVLLQSTTTTDAVSIAVTLVVGANATLSLSPTMLNFYYTTGAANPASQIVTLTSSGGFIPFQVVQNYPSWLNVTPISGSVNSGAPVGLTVGVTPNSPNVLGTGTHSATLTIVPTTGGASLSVTVNLIVSTNPFLTQSATQLSFNATFAGAAPAAQMVTIGSTGAALGFTATTSSLSNWLTVSPSSGVTGQASGTLSIGINPTNLLSTLGVGTYNGTVTVTPNNGDPYTLQIAVTLVVTATSQIMSAPQSVFFSYEMGQAQPATQTLVLSTSGPASNFTVSTVVTASTGCGSANWLSAVPQVSPLTTPNYLNVSVSTSGIAAGTCMGTIKILYGTSQETDVPVMLFVSGSTTPLLNISLPQGFGVETTTVGGGSIQRTISLSSTDGTTALPYQVTSQSSPCAWLFADASTGSSAGTTPAPISVLISPGCITNPGIYQGTITITANSLPQAVILPITLIVNSNITVGIAPTSLTFNQTQGGPAPNPQLLAFNVTGGNASFIATASTAIGSWLSVTPTSGSTSVGTLTVSATGSGLVPNTYTGTISVSLTGASTSQIQIPVKLVIGAPQTLTVAPTSLGFSYVITGSAPGSQQLTVTSTGGPVSFTVGTTSSGGWLSTSSTTGTTGTTGSTNFNVSVDPTKFPAGTVGGNALSGSITINAPSISSTPFVVPVTVNIASAPMPAPTTISNSALPNTGFGAIAPGELITIKGSNLGPATPAAGTSFTVNAQGGLDSTLAGVMVTFDGLPGTPTYVSATQINVIVPWEISGRASTNVVVVYNGVQSSPIPQQVTTVKPGIFTLNATGSGQAAAVNLTGATAGSINGPAGGVPVGSVVVQTQPATAGSYIAVFGNGGGPTNPASVTGSVTPAAAYPLFGWTAGSSVVTATIGGVNAPVQYAGAAPTLINGILQVNLQVPSGVSGAALAVSITIDGVPTPVGATIAVQ